MEFVTNNINLGKAKTMEQLLEEAIAKKTAQHNANLVKTASVKETEVTKVAEVKVAEESKEDSKGGLTAAQKKLPEALQEAILKKKDGKEDKTEDKKEDKKEDKVEDKKEEKKEEPKEEKKAISSTTEFKKIANLSKEDKSKVREFFNRYWPAPYVDAVIADK